MNHRYSSCAVALLSFAMLTLSACHESLPSVANTPVPLPLPQPPQTTPEVLPPVIRCAPDTGALTAASDSTQLASDCHVAAAGAAS